MSSNAPPGNSGAAIHASGVTVQVESGGRVLKLLDGIDLTIVPGEMTALIGPNGSGKSTLLRTISRILRPDSGAVLLGGDDLYGDVDARTAAKNIGMVPQDTHIAFDFTVRDIVAMGRSPHRPRLAFLAGESDNDREVVDSALHRAGISAELAARPIATLSGGERQRALIARGLAQEARILLLDEPTASLDIHHEGALLSWLRELVSAEQRTVVVVLHDLNMAAQYADRVVIMHHGRIVADGTPAEALTAERIRAVYGMPVWVRAHPATARPYILNLPAAGGDLDCPDLAGLRVHLLGGGGYAAPLMMRLAAAGADVTVGALNQGDTDQEAAVLLGTAHSVSPPFSALTRASIDEAIAIGSDAAFVVVCEIPFGDGNIGTLEIAESLAAFGNPIILASTESSLAPTRDFSTGKAASAAWDRLASLAVTQIGDPITLLRAAAANEKRPARPERAS